MCRIRNHYLVGTINVQVQLLENCLIDQYFISKHHRFVACIPVADLYHNSFCNRNDCVSAIRVFNT